MQISLPQVLAVCWGITQVYGAPASSQPASSSSTFPPFPRPTRYITANDENGNSYFYKDINTTVAISYEFGNSGSSQSLAYTNDRAPAQISNVTDIKEYKNVLKNPPESLYRLDGGANVWFIDVPPKGISPLHRTISVDYVVAVAGALKLQTSDNDTRILNTGDMVINRAVLHSWTNESPTEWCRLMAVITTVQPVVTKNNGTLESTLPG
ncbi:MAG: hypothetical protein M1828_001129 [Chrysothrix sp. TS-e1954]|nr:MAG: hypothetical protein M1828_001129 [Chrysothrix sp. TS-e1954]